MTSSSSLPPASRSYGRVLCRAFGIASAVVTVVAWLVWRSGVVVADSGDLVAWGVFAAVGASAAALLLHVRILAMRPGTGGSDGALLAARLQGLLGAAFLMKLVVVAIAVLSMRQAGAKFETIAIFAITFAVASIIGQVISASLVARAIGSPPSRPAGPVAVAAGLDEASSLPKS